MTKLIGFSLPVLLTFAIILSSCSKSEDPVPELPSITLQSGGDYVSASKTVTANAPLKFGIRALANSGSNASLVAINMSRNMNGNIQKYDTTFSSNAYNVDLTTTANQQVGKETFTFTVKDNNGQSNSTSLIITTTAPTRGE